MNLHPDSVVKMMALSTRSMFRCTVVEGANQANFGTFFDNFLDINTTNLTTYKCFQFLP